MQGQNSLAQNQEKSKLSKNQLKITEIINMESTNS